MIPSAYSLPLLQGSSVGRARTIFQNDWFCTRNGRIWKAKKERKKTLNCTSSKSRLYGRFCCYRWSTLFNYNIYPCTGIFWLNWMAQGFFLDLCTPHNTAFSTRLFFHDISLKFSGRNTWITRTNQHLGVRSPFFFCLVWFCTFVYVHMYVSVCVLCICVRVHVCISV